MMLNHRGPAACVAALSIILGILGCGGSALAGHHDRGGSTSAPQAPRLDARLVDYLTPSDGAQVSAGVAALATFTHEVDTRAVDACMQKHALQAPPTLPPIAELARFGTPAEPNLPAIRSSRSLGLSVALHAAPMSKRAMAAASRPQYIAELRLCERNAPTFAVDTGMGAMLYQSWLGEVNAVDRAPAVQVATEQGASCTARTNFPSQSILDLEEVIEAKIRPLLTKAHDLQARRLERLGVSVLLRCFSKPVDIAAHLLAIDQERFLAANASALGVVESAMQRESEDATRTYGVRLPGPPL